MKFGFAFCKIALFCLLFFGQVFSNRTTAQVTVPVQNPSFEAGFVSHYVERDLCGVVNSGTIPGWTSSSGKVFTWNGTCGDAQEGLFPGVERPPDGKSVAYLQNSWISQDLGVPVTNGTYKLTFSVASWFYWYPGHYTATIGQGKTPICTTSGYVPGDFTQVVLECPVPYYISHYNGFSFPPGNLTISFSGDSNWPIEIDNVSLVVQ